MPIPLRPLDYIKQKYATRATAAAGDFQFGVQNPLRDWATNAAAAEGAWRDGVQDAIARGAFGKGVKAAGTQFWQARTLTLGVPRYTQGVQASVDLYADRFKPYYEALSRVTLPPRGKRGDPRNLERVRVIIEALRRVKTGGSTATA